MGLFKEFYLNESKVMWIHPFSINPDTYVLSRQIKTKNGFKVEYFSFSDGWIGSHLKATHYNKNEEDPKALNLINQLKRSHRL